MTVPRPSLRTILLRIILIPLVVTTTGFACLFATSKQTHRTYVVITYSEAGK